MLTLVFVTIHTKITTVGGEQFVKIAKLQLVNLEGNESLAILELLSSVQGCWKYQSVPVITALVEIPHNLYQESKLES